MKLYSIIFKMYRRKLILCFYETKTYCYLNANLYYYKERKAEGNPLHRAQV